MLTAKSASGPSSQPTSKRLRTTLACHTMAVPMAILELHRLVRLVPCQHFNFLLLRQSSSFLLASSCQVTVATATVVVVLVMAMEVAVAVRL